MAGDSDADQGKAMARRGSARRRKQRGGDTLNQLPWRRLRNRYKPIEVLDEDGLEAIHNASMRILEEHGLEFLHDEARSILRRAGA